MRLMRKILGALLCAALLTLPLAGVAEEPAVQTDAADEPVMTSEELHIFVEQLFAAATGTTQENETALRKGMTEAEIAERSAENVLYRAMTLPWLKEALRPVQSNAGAEPELTPEPTPAPTAEAVGEDDGEAAFTLEDSYEAMRANELGTAYLESLLPLGGTDMASCMEVTRQLVGLWMAEIDHAELSGINSEYACWLYSPGSLIDYPVVHGENNTYYLKRMFNGAANSAGTLFIDYRNLPGFQDPNTLIYGHNMRNNSMFGSLTDYYIPTYYEAHPYALLLSADEISLVEIFAGYVTDEKDHCYDIALSDEDDMRAFVKEAKRKSDFDAGVEVEMTDRLVTLSTCAYAFENARYIAIGRLLPVWQAQSDVLW